LCGGAVVALVVTLACPWVFAEPMWIPEVRPKWIAVEDGADGCPAVTVRKAFEFSTADANCWLTGKAIVDATLATRSERNPDPIVGGLQGSHAWLAGPLSWELAGRAKYETDQPLDNQYGSAGIGFTTLNAFDDDSFAAALGYYLLPNVSALADGVWALASSDRESLGADPRDEFLRLSLELKWENYLDLIGLRHVRYEIAWTAYREVGTDEAWEREQNDSYCNFRAELMYDLPRTIAWCDGIFAAYRHGQTPTDMSDENRFEVGIRFFGDYKE
jgi:hypothetical protein